MEGNSWKRKHRLHLYTKPSYEVPAVHCWNCGYSSNLYGYLKEFHPSTFPLYVKAKRGEGFLELKMKYREDEIDEIDEIDVGLNLSNKDGVTIPETNEDASKPILIEPIGNLSSPPKEAIDYIEGRGLKFQDNWLYSDKNNKIRFNNMDVLLSDFIVIPLTIEGKWFGFQALAWKQKQFFIYLVTGNSSWKIENWDNVDKSAEVFIMESIYDRLSTGILNSVAALGSNIHIDRLKELDNPIFCLDNQNVDDKSKEETLKYLELGYKCFLWPTNTPENIKDFNDLRKKGVPEVKIENLIRNNIYSGISGIVRLKMNS